MVQKSDVQILCQNIKYLRREHELSKGEMAHILGVGIRTLNDIERGILPPRISCEMLFRIQHHFGISPGQLFTPIEIQ